MKVLVVGGTHGFGAAVSARLMVVAETVVVGRSFAGCEPAGYVCDLANVLSWQETLDRIALDHPVLDLVVALVGYARLKPSSFLTEQEWQLTEQLNLGYVVQAYQRLQPSLVRSAQPRLATIGSRWSYLTGNDLLVPYIAAKHQLRSWTAELASNEEWLQANHYCVPTMATPQHAELLRCAVSDGHEEAVAEGGFTETADPVFIAERLASLMLSSMSSGLTYVIGKEGEMSLLPVAVCDR